MRSVIARYANQVRIYPNFGIWANYGHGCVTYCYHDGDRTDDAAIRPLNVGIDLEGRVNICSAWHSDCYRRKRTRICLELSPTTRVLYD